MTKDADVRRSRLVDPDDQVYAQLTYGSRLELAVFLGGDPYERLTHMVQQARANEVQFLEHLILRAEAI